MQGRLQARQVFAFVSNINRITQLTQRVFHTRFEEFFAQLHNTLAKLAASQFFNLCKLHTLLPNHKFGFERKLACRESKCRLSLLTSNSVHFKKHPTGENLSYPQ